MNLLATVFKYAERTALIEKSPAEGMGFIPRGKGQARVPKRAPFPVEGVPTFLSALKARQDDSYLVALILAHSGMRLEEAGGLRGRDVREREGVWGFSIQPGEGRSLKTATAQRFVPLHPVLVKAGVVERAKERGERWLFDLTADKHGKRTSALSKTFGQGSASVGSSDGPSVGWFNSTHYLGRSLVLYCNLIHQRIHCPLATRSNSALPDNSALGCDMSV